MGYPRQTKWSWYPAPTWHEKVESSPYYEHHTLLHWRKRQDLYQGVQNLLSKGIWEPQHKSIPISDCRDPILVLLKIGVDETRSLNTAYQVFGMTAENHPKRYIDVAFSTILLLNLMMLMSWKKTNQLNTKPGRTPIQQKLYLYRIGKFSLKVNTKAPIKDILPQNKVRYWFRFRQAENCRSPMISPPLALL